MKVSVIQSDIDDLISSLHASKVGNDKEGRLRESYFKTYPYLLSLCAKRRFNEVSDLAHCALAVYGWMPTTPAFDFSKIDDALQEIQNAIVSERRLDVAGISSIQSFVNNSVVGSSKLLHFIMPDRYAIWDSKVFCAVTGKAAYDYRMKNPRNYIEYLRFLDSIQVSPNMIDQVTVALGYDAPITRMRLLELLYFINGGLKASNNFKS